MDEKTTDGAGSPPTDGKPRPVVRARLVRRPPSEEGRSQPTPRVRPVIRPLADAQSARPRIRVEETDLARLRAGEQPYATPVPPQPPAPPPDTAKPCAGSPLKLANLGMEFVYVPPGRFEMGSTDGSGDETPVHEVQIRRGFWLGKYPVLQVEYDYVTNRNPSRHRAPRRPVENVSWADARRFCAELTDREYQAFNLPDGYEYRLPTEAEWEYAARGGAAAEATVFAGSTSVAKVAWYGANSGGRTRVVGMKQPNELGLYDMSGNVWEWCWDWYRTDFYGNGPTVDPVSARASAGRVIRGGSWMSPASATRVAARNGCWPYNPDGDTGFRVCLGPTLPTMSAETPDD